MQAGVQTVDFEEWKCLVCNKVVLFTVTYPCIAAVHLGNDH